MVVTFENKLCATGILVMELTQHRGPVLLIEYIVYVNEEEPPILLLQVMLPKHLHLMNTPLNYDFQLSTDLFCNAGLFGLWYGHHKYLLGEIASSCFSYPYRSSDRLLVHPYQASHHQSRKFVPGRKVLW